MAKSFNLTAELNLRGPSNIKNVVSQIRKQLGTITADVSLKIDPKASKNIDIIAKKLQVMNTALVQAKGNSDNLNTSLRNLAISMETIKNTGTTSSSSIQKTASSLQNTTKATKQATDQIQEFGRQSALAVRRFAAFSIVTTGIYSLINAVSSGTKAFIDFDRQLVKLQQVTGKSRTELTGISDEITRLAINLGVSSSSLIEVASTLAQAGISAKDTKIALEALAKTELAPSFDNLKDTTEGAIAAIRQFGLETAELESALGSINAVAAAFAVESSDIIAAIQRTGGVFASASKGVSEGTDALNEFIAVFTSVRATTRESAETIATGLRTIFTRIQRAKTIEQLKEFGIELTDLEGKFVGSFEAVKRLSEALNQLDPRDIRFSSIVEELGGFRQIGKVIPLIQQFATAQEALKVAQRGQDSLTAAQITAQQSLANQLAKVREQFLALVREVGQSSAFQNLFKIITGLASGFVSLLGAFKPILPLLGLLGAIKGLGAITKFGSGLFQGLGKGSASASGQNIGETISGAKEKEKAEATAIAADAIKLNTNALNSLTTAIQNLQNTIKTSGSTTLNQGGKVLGFNRGGVVPGSGRGDKVPAMLEPGEVVINNQAAQKYGRGNLVRMNKFAEGGKLFRSDKKYGMLVAQENNPPDVEPGSVQFTDPKTNDSYTAGLRISGFKSKNKSIGAGVFNTYASKINQAIDVLDADLAQSLGKNQLNPSITKKAQNATVNAKGFMFENYVLTAAGLPDPKSNIFDITRSNKTLKSLTDESVVGLTDIKLGNNSQQQARVIDKARRARPNDFKEVSKFMAGSVGGVSVRNRAYVVDYDDTMAESDAVVKTGVPDPYEDFRGQRAAEFIKSAKATRYAEMIKKRVAKGYDIHVLTARPNEPQTIDAIQEFMMRAVGSRATSVIGTAELSEMVGGTAQAKASELSRLKKSYDQIVFLDDNQENVLAASAVEGVKARIARKFDGGLIQKFMAGSVGGDGVQSITEPLSAQELYEWIQSLGTPQEIRGLAGGNEFIDAKLSKIKSKTPVTSQEIFKKNFLLGDRSGPYLEIIQELLTIADSKKKKPRIFTEDEKANATKLGLVGMLPFGVDELLYEQIGDKVVAIQMKSLTKDKALVVDQMRKDIDTVLGKGTQALYGDPGKELDSATKEALGLGNLEGYMIEAILAKAGANPGKLNDRSVDYASGLGSAASLFGIDPNIPTEVKRDVKGGLSKARANFRNYFAKLAFGGRAEGPSFEEVRQQIIDKYPEIQFRISKRKRGFGYNLMGALKSAGGLFGDSSLNFQQPTNLKQLQEYSDKLASKLMNPQELAEGGSAKPQKNFGKIALRTGNRIQATYMKDGQAGQDRSGQVIADKINSSLYAVQSSAATKGYGPKLYDIVMEAATAAGAMLTSDRRTVSEAAKAVWSYYFNNRSDIKKTRLDPENWVSNSRLLDEKLYGPPETWPPSTDPAWILQTGYSKSPSDINNPDLVQKLAKGGSSGTVPAMVSNGEAYVPPNIAKAIGYAKLDKMNQADRNGMKGFAGGGISTFKGPGSGTSDSIGPIGLPTGSYVIREKATKALGLNKGGAVGIQSFKKGTKVSPAERTLSQEERKRRKEQFSAEQRGGVTRLEARSVGMPRPDFGAGASRKRDVMATPQGEMNVKNIEAEVLNNYKKLYAEEKKRIDELYSKLGQEAYERYSKGEIDLTEFNTTMDDLQAISDLAKKQAKDKLTTQATAATEKAVQDYTQGKQTSRVEERKAVDMGAFDAEVKSAMDAVVKEAKSKYEALYSEEKQRLKDYYQAKAKNVADEGGDVLAVIEEYRAAVGELKESIQSGFGAEVKEKQAQVPEQIAEQKTQQVQSLRAADAVDSTYLQAQEAKAKADLIAAEQAEFFAFKAKQAGLSTEQYQRKLAAETAKLAKDLSSDLKAKQIDLKQSTINVGAGLKGRSRSGSDEDKEFIKKAENTLIEKLQAIDPSAQLKDLEVTAAKLVDQMIAADVSFDDLVDNNETLSQAFSKNITEAEATAEAMKVMSEKTGIAAEILENQIGEMVAARRTPMGAFKSNVADVVDSLGGPIRVLGIGMTIVGDQVGKLITSLDSNTKQNVTLMTALGAFTGAAQGMVAGQVIGAEGGKLLEKVFPDLPGLGKKFEIVSTAVGTAIGLINGAADAYYRSKLDIVLANIAKSGQEVDIAFERLAKNNTPENFASAQKALKNSSQNIMDLADQGNIGAGGTSRTILEWMRGLDPTGITSRMSGQATEKEARESFVGQVGSQVDRASQLGDIRIKQVSGKEIEASVKQIQEFDKQIGELKKTGGAGAEGAIKDIQNAKQEFLSTRSQVFGQLREIYATDKDAFLALYIESAKRSGMTAEQIADAIKTPKGLEEAIQKGKEISASYAEQEQKARLLADASRKVVIATENILNIYRLLEAGLVRFSSEISNIVSDVNQLTSAYEGNAAIQAPRRTDEQIFSNVSAYSQEEVAGAAARAGALAGGGQRGADIERRIIGAKAIKDELPKILQGITSGDTDEAMKQIADRFDEMGIELDPAVFDQLSKTLEQKLLGQEQGATASELAEDPALLESLSKISEETLKSAGMMAKAFNDAMSSTIDLINKYGQSIEQATEWQLKAANIRLSAENQLAQTLGQNLTLQQLNAPQENRIRGLTASNVLPGGSMDPNAIFRSMQTMIEDIPNQEQELEKRQLALAGATSDAERERAKKAVDDQIKYMAEQNAAINNSQQALEELANDSQAASNALNKLGEQQKLAQASTNMMQKVLTSTPTELNDINKQIAAYTKMISGGATDRDIGSLDFRQAAFGGLNMVQSLMPENIQRQMQAKMTREMISRMPGGQKLLETKTGALGPDGEPMTMEQALNLTETGRDPIQEQYLNEYAAATERQASAADRLGEAAVRVGETTVAGVDAILTKLTEELPKKYAQAVEQSTPKPVVQTNTTPEPSEPLMPDPTGTQNLIDKLGAQSEESTGHIVRSITALTGVVAVGFAALKMTGGMGTLRNIAGRIPGLRGAGGAAAAAGKMPGGTMAAQAAKTAAAGTARATAGGASTGLAGAARSVGNLGGAMNSAGQAISKFSGSFAGQMIAFNTGMSAVTNAMEFASDPTAYIASLQEKSDAELRMVQEGRMGVAMLQGAMEGLSDPIGKIAEGVVTLKGLADDLGDAANRAARTRRIEEQGKEIRLQQRGGKGKNQELSRLSAEEANKAMRQASVSVELRALKEIQARGGSVEDFAKMTGSTVEAFRDPNTGEMMDINQLIQQRQGILDKEFSGEKSEDYKKVVDKEIQYREQELDKERKRRDVVVENTATVTPPPPPAKPADIPTPTRPVVEAATTPLPPPAKPADIPTPNRPVKPRISVENVVGNDNDDIASAFRYNPVVRGVMSPEDRARAERGDQQISSISNATQNPQTSRRFVPPQPTPRPVVEATAPLQPPTRAKPNTTAIAIKKQEASETQANLDRLESSRIAKEAEIAKKEKKLKTARIAAVGAGTLKTSERVASAQSSVDMAQQDLASINEQITAEKQRLAALAEQVRIEEQGARQQTANTTAGVGNIPYTGDTRTPPQNPGALTEYSVPTSYRNPTQTSQSNTQRSEVSTTTSPNNTMGYSLSIDEKTTQFLTNLQTTFNSFGDYISRLEKASGNIPDKIDLVLKAEPIEVKITGGAVVEALQSVPEFIQDMINKSIREKTKTLRDIWNATGGAIGSNPRT